MIPGKNLKDSIVFDVIDCARRFATRKIIMPAIFVSKINVGRYAFFIRDGVKTRRGIRDDIKTRRDIFYELR